VCWMWISAVIFIDKVTVVDQAIDREGVIISLITRVSLPPAHFYNNINVRFPSALFHCLTRPLIPFVYTAGSHRDVRHLAPLTAAVCMQQRTHSVPSTTGRLC